MNSILILGSDNNDYLKLTLNAFKLPYKIITDSLDLLNLNITDGDYSLIIKGSTIIRREFNIHLYELLKYRENLIVGYDSNIGLDLLAKFPNILNNHLDEYLDKNTFLKKIIPISNNINSNTIIKFNINSFIINNKIVLDFLNDNKINLSETTVFNELLNYILQKELDLFNNNITNNTVFNNITTINYFKTITYKDPVYKVQKAEYYLFSDLIKKNTIKAFNNNFNQLYNNIYNCNYEHTDLNIITKNIFNTNSSVLLIANNKIAEIIKILDNISKNYVNTHFNIIYILTEKDNLEIIKKDISKKNVILSKNINFIGNTNNLNILFKLFNSIIYNKDIYLLTTSKINLNTDCNNIINRLFINNNIDYQNLCIKFNNYTNIFFKLIPNIIKKYVKEVYNTNCSIYHCLNYIQKSLAYLSNKYFTGDVYNINLNYNISNKNTEDIKLYNFKLEFDEEFLENIFDKKEYDIIFKCISHLFINKIPTEQSIIFKYIAISPYTNYQYTYNDYDTLFSYLTLKDKSEIITIFNILFYKVKDANTINLLFEIMSSNFEIKENNIILYTILVYYSNILDKPIDITNDNIILINFINNLKYIKLNLESECKEINCELDYEIIYNNILNFILTRLNLLDTEYVDKFNKVYYENKSIKNMNNMNDEELNNYIKEDFNSSLNMGMCLSDVMITTKDILLQRGNSIRYISALKEIISNEFHNLDITNVSISQLLNIINVFKYSYHGIPNKNFFKDTRYCFQELYKSKLKQKYSKLVNQLVKEGYLMDNNENFFNYEFKDTNPKKILFISEFLDRKHSVFKDRHQVIKYLANNGFEVYLGLKNKLNYKFSNIYNGIKECIILNSINELENVKSIRKHNFDKVIFCEVGMSGLCSILANFKLGRVTFNTWGHSDTSGCKYIDYYVSSKYYELPYEQSKEHYSEELIIQNGLCTSYVNPINNYDLKIPRTFFGLSKYDKIILCPQSLFKIYPDYDTYLFEILYRLPEVNLVFVDAMDKKYKMYERWDTKMDKKYHGILSRVKFIPGINHEKFVNLINNSDIMLDPFPFGGCNTSFEGIACGVPIVTQRADVINGRFTAGFYEYMGFTDLIAKDKEDYINLTCKLINNKEFYNHCVKQIKENGHKVFMDQKTLVEWKELMENK